MAKKKTKTKKKKSVKKKTVSVDAYMRHKPDHEFSSNTVARYAKSHGFFMPHGYQIKKIK
jgi:ubiquinone biosynthesis protein COQ9